MAIKDLEGQVELAKLYDALKQAQTYAGEWAQNVVQLSSQVKQHVLYAAEASVDDKAYIDATEQAHDMLVKAAPAIPDKAPIDIAPVAQPPILANPGKTP